ncbi:DUF262 domain-containing protein [Empedobacter falsenii]|uniref:DUF262 domain-containing protein n=1 Tax=Empedobacter falsenii TaxID=343874 RepID=UPI002575FD86|nr:DUF262 domain-containing protein [Empedobacter falsenii]MDM1547201.1 DUF262 domain-containing protein [Empedobacter falsenii]
MSNNYTFKEIAKWQLESKNSKVVLPDLQRGFVWKSKQIEDLWDSILRGYPIGSFLLSTSGEKNDLLDGQQRATAIFLGYYNPFKINESIAAWSIKSQLPVVWIDIAPENKPKLSLYAIRVVTNSHPWGYQIQNNDIRLTESDRRSAIEIFKINPDNQSKGYTKFENTTVFPYDCSYPIPLSFFLEAENVAEVLKMVEMYLPNYIKTKRGSFENKEEFIQKLNNDLVKNIEVILTQIKAISDKRIHANVVSEEVIQQENQEENPTLFQRINSSGTTLSGDDLIYSIYKTIFPGTKRMVEDIGLSFIPPTQVISLITRIAVSDTENDKFVKKLNIRDFQNKIKDKNFRDKLEGFVKGNEIKKAIDTAIDILSCRNNDQFKNEVPPVVIKSFIKHNQDLFLTLLYWLYNNNAELTSEHKFKIAGKIYLFHLFNFSNIKALWESEIQNKDFWIEPINEYIWWGNVDGINFIIPPHLLENFYENPEVLNRFKTDAPERWGLLESNNEIKEYFEKIKVCEIDHETANKYFEYFIGNLRGTRILVLLAQREYVNDKFIDFNQLEDFDDTNTPWDWDHIYPSEWVKSKSNINNGIRDWNNSNGNFRVLSLDQNRSESNSLSPKLRLESELNKKISFVSNSDYQYWEQIDGRIYSEQIDNHFYAITTRMINIYKKFWEDFKINEFIK